MRKVIVDMSPSIDGFVAGNGVSVDHPFGDAGDRLHRWIGLDGGQPNDADDAASHGTFETAGAVVIGRRMFDVGIGPWGDDGAFKMPTFVVTSRPAEPVVKGPTTFTFVTDGVRAAIAAAQNAAGEKDVVVSGGADIVQQCLAAGLVDVLRLHVVPVLLGSGTRLFADDGAANAELEQVDIMSTPLATHITFGVASRVTG